MIENKSTLLGTVQDVNGTTVSVSLADGTICGLTYVNGQGYRIGQIGSFVKVPIGYVNLFGIVTQVGASAVPEKQILVQPHGNCWLTIQLIGEGQRDGKFDRGISQYPTIGDEVHLVSENDLKSVYGQPDQPYFVKVGHIAGAESIPALIDINKLVTRHSAIVGTTGSGKSTTVASLINSLSNPEIYPSARILILDIHGEYGKALKDRADIFKINADKNNNEKELYLPFWALSFEELAEISFNSFSNERDKNILLERVLNEKRNSIITTPRDGVNEDNVSVDTPIPFSLNHLWYDLWKETLGTYYKKNAGRPIDNLAYEKDPDGNDMLGNPSLGIPPTFKKIKDDAGDNEKINYLPAAPPGLSSPLQSLGAKLRIPRYDFIYKPGDWLPNENGVVKKDLDSLLMDWIGSNKPITILDLSGVPVSILNLIIGVLLRILYDALFWARKLAQGGRERPLLIVMEEAHNYLNDNFTGLASSTVQKIAKEGRKYGIGAMIVSQRPSEINSTILSQCGTFFALRLANSTDRSHITSAIADNLEGLTSMLPILRTGEAIILGEAVKLPMRCIIDPPEKDKRPDSHDPVVYDVKGKDESQSYGWAEINTATTKDYEQVMRAWRSQSPTSIEIIKGKTMEKISVSSSNIKAIGYDTNTQTLEVEFLNGGTYQYFDVSENVYKEFIGASSHGQYLAKNIKGKYRFAKV